MTESRTNPDWRPLALSLALVATVYAVVYRFIPWDERGYLLYPFGAWALYSGARLSMRVALPLTIGVFAMTDLILYRGNAVPPNYLFYPLLGASVLIGHWLLSRSQSPWRIVGGAVGSFALFFLVSNGVAWLEGARDYYRPHTFATLVQAYVEGLEYLRMQPGQLIGDLVLSFALFGAHAALAKAHFPAERVVATEATV